MTITRYDAANEMKYVVEAIEAMFEYTEPEDLKSGEQFEHIYKITVTVEEIE